MSGFEKESGKITCCKEYRELVCEQDQKTEKPSDHMVFGQPNKMEVPHQISVYKQSQKQVSVA